MNKVILAGISALFVAVSMGYAQSTAFTYQGELRSEGAPVNGSFDLTFGLFPSAGGPGQLGTSQLLSPVTISNGLFTVTLDFGNSFPGAERWLEISVRTNGASEFITLAPRQKVTSTPYAIYAAGAATAGAAGSATNFVGSLSGDVTGSQSATVVGSVGGQSAANIANVATTVSAATSANTPDTLVKRDASGSIQAATVRGSSFIGDGSGLTQLEPANIKAGTAALSITGNAATAAAFTGALSGDVTGLQTATVVSSVGGQSAASVASGASSANAATAANAAGQIVKRDASGNFAAGAVTVASISGSGAGLTGLNGANLVNGSVGTAQLADGAVTSSRLASGAALANLNASGQNGVPTGGVILSSRAKDSNLVNAGYTRIGTAALGELWQVHSNAPLGIRYFNSAIWTGTEMIVWGGATNGAYFRDGARYNPVTESWTTVTLTGAPEGRATHTAIWTGTEMIVWGGNSNNAATSYQTGGRYNPSSDSWIPVSISGSPSGRTAHTAVWTGKEMLIWGGYVNATPVPLGTGGRYNPTTDTWTPISTVGAPSPRYQHAAVWTGTHLLVWGGYNNGQLNDGGRYDPASDTWSPITATGAPLGKNAPTYVWTGSEMIIWGGDAIAGSNQGARYNPTTDVWTALPTTGAPSARYYNAAVWTGSEMLIWGGYAYGPVAADGARFNPVANTWSPIAATGPIGRYGANLGVWTGSELLVFGGYNFGLTPSFFNDAHSYTPPRTLSLYAKP